MLWKDVSRLTDKENFSILNSNSYLEMLWEEICLVGAVDRFHCIISLLTAFDFIALLIAFSK